MPEWLGILFGLTLVGSMKANLHHGHTRTDIYFAAFFPMTPGTPEGKIGTGVMPAVRLAIKHINKSQDILRGYKLQMYWNDTQCNPGVGLKAFFDMVHLNPKKLVLFGAACSPVTDQIAKAAKHWNLVQLTYADTHPMFTEKSFPHFFRVVPSENEFNPPRLSILRYFNWTRVGTLYQNEAKYSLAHNHLVSELEKNNVSIIESQSFNDEITNQLDILTQKDIRIILGNFNESWARHIFCDAFAKGVYSPKFQWLIVGMYDENWWLKEAPCQPEDIKRALLGAMILDILPLASSEEITVSAMTPLEYEREYKNLTKHFSRYHGYAYDGVWAAALAIQEVGRKAHLFNTSLADFSYRSKAWEQLFVEALDKTSFEGVTGPVRFKENSRRGNVVIKQVMTSVGEENEITENCIGEYSGVTRTLYLERCGKLVWLEERPPRDRTITRIQDARVDLTIFSTLVTIASLGIILAACFLIINIKFRNQRQIKMSSPNMNNLIIIGCILTYSSVIILGLDSYLTSMEAFPYICTARAWILMSGFTLSFGSMFSKTWRVHSIFTNVQLNKKVMKDSQLYLVVGTLISIDVIIMTVWQSTDPFYRETKELEPYPQNNDYDGVLIIPRIESCKSEHMSIFVGCIYAYKGLLMLFGAFLAWETRQVQIPALNDSKYVGMSVYNVAIMCVLGVAVSFVLKDEQNASFIIISIFIIFCTTGTLCLVFVPKILDLKRDPHGTMNNRGKPTIKTGGNVIMKTPLQTMEEKLRIANKVNKKYLELLEELDNNFKEAMMELGNEEVQNILTNQSKQVLIVKKEEVTNSSICSDQTSTQAENGDFKETSGPKTCILHPSTPNSSEVKNFAPIKLSKDQSHGSSTNASDYFSLNSHDVDYISHQICNGHQLDLCIPEIGSGMEFSNFSDLFPEGTPPPPPPMFGSPIQESLAEKQIEVCEPLTYLDNDVCSGHPDCVGSDCSDDDDDWDEGDDDYDDEGEDEVDINDANVKPKGCHHILNCDKQGSTNAHEVFDTQSYLTYEDQATQTEDEDDQDPDLHDLIFLLYDDTKTKQRSLIFSPSMEDLTQVQGHSHYSKIKTSQQLKYHHEKTNSENELCDNDDGGMLNQTLSNHHLSQLDSCEILPIFHKLLEDKYKRRAFAESSSRSHDSSRASSRFNAARSCPDMSVRCDIVEYL